MRSSSYVKAVTLLIGDAAGRIRMGRQKIEFVDRICEGPRVPGTAAPATNDNLHDERRLHSSPIRPGESPPDSRLNCAGWCGFRQPARI